MVRGSARIFRVSGVRVEVLADWRGTCPCEIRRKKGASGQAGPRLVLANGASGAGRDARSVCQGCPRGWGPWHDRARCLPVAGSADAGVRNARETRAGRACDGLTSLRQRSRMGHPQAAGRTHSLSAGQAARSLANGVDARLSLRQTTLLARLQGAASSPANRFHQQRPEPGRAKKNNALTGGCGPAHALISPLDRQKLRPSSESCKRKMTELSTGVASCGGQNDKPPKSLCFSGGLRVDWGFLRRKRISPGRAGPAGAAATRSA